MFLLFRMGDHLTDKSVCERAKLSSRIDKSYSLSSCNLVAEEYTSLKRQTMCSKLILKKTQKVSFSMRDVIFEILYLPVRAKL